MGVLEYSCKSKSKWVGFVGGYTKHITGA